jgi:protoporphyrin/coproporphyrin ferrochelatase
MGRDPVWDPYDGILLLSFGGPESPQDVMPFLENVTRGRGVPPARLREVAGHYWDRGGRSPMNDQSRALLSALRAELDSRGWTIPVYWGNRNWSPYLAEALGQAYDEGGRRLLVILTSAFSSYSGCRQYREDLAAAVRDLTAQGRQLAVDKVRPYFNHPAFVSAVTDRVRAAQERAGSGSRLVFVTHSLPQWAQRSSGPYGDAYVDQHRDLAATVTAGLDTGPETPWDLVFCSRSGPPDQPWLEPDIEDHLRELAAAGVRGVVVVPLGFLSDHMEVVHDLDVVAAGVAEELGLDFIRAGTVGTHPDFVTGLVDLALERARQARGEPVEPATVGEQEAAPSVCAPGCCAHPVTDLPAVCGADEQTSPDRGRSGRPAMGSGPFRETTEPAEREGHRAGGPNASGRSG